MTLSKDHPQIPITVNFNMSTPHLSCWNSNQNPSFMLKLQPKIPHSCWNSKWLILYGNITPEKVRKSRQMQFLDKTAYVWGLRYRWDPSLSMNPIRRFAYFMPPWSTLLLRRFFWNTWTSLKQIFLDSFCRTLSEEKCLVVNESDVIVLFEVCCHGSFELDFGTFASI